MVSRRRWVCCWVQRKPRPRKSLRRLSGILAGSQSDRSAAGACCADSAAPARPAGRAPDPRTDQQQRRLRRPHPAASSRPRVPGWRWRPWQRPPASTRARPAVAAGPRWDAGSLLDAVRGDQYRVMRDPQGLRDIAPRCRQDGQAIGQFGDGAQILQGVGLHQHAHGTDFLESLPVSLQPLPGTRIGTDQEEGTCEGPVVRTRLAPAPASGRVIEWAARLRDRPRPVAAV